MSTLEERLRLDVSLAGGIGRPDAVVRVHGEFDRSQVPRFDHVTTSLPSELVSVTVDLAGTTIIDSAALGALARLNRRLDRDRCRFEIVVDKPFQIKVLRVSGLFDFLNARIAT